MRLLTPEASLVGIVAFVPIAALLVARRRAGRVRRALRLADPPRTETCGRVVLLALAAGLLAVAAGEPAVERTVTGPVRTDAATVVAFDISRSMLARGSPSAPARIERAKAIARRLRDVLPGHPMGVAAFTDRSLPYLFPTPDAAAFDRVVTAAIGVNRPPPSSARGRSGFASLLASLGAVADQGYFPAASRRRLLVVLTDGESPVTGFVPMADAFRRNDVRLVVVHVWAPGERVFAHGRPADYRSDPGSRAVVAQLAELAGGAALAEVDFGSIVVAARSALGAGPTSPGRQVSRTTRLLSPYFAAAALAPLLLLLARRPRA